MTKFSVRKPLTVFMVVIVILILGVVSFMNMTPDLLPNMDFPYVIIMTAYPGASPESVEAEITKPMEQSMATLEHIKNVTSNSSENYSLVMLEFEESVNMDTIGVDIQQNLSALSGSWDDAVGSPYVLKINPSVLPVEVAAVSMEGMDVIELSDFVEETLLPKLEGVTGVASISTMGTVTRQVHVIIDEDKINDVNARLEAAVNGQLDDARAELEDTKAELEDAQAQLQGAGGQLDSGRDALVSQTSQAEAAINQQQLELLQGKMQIQQQLVSLNETRATLQSSLNSLTELQGQIETLQESKAQLESALAGIDALDAALAEAQAALDDVQAQIDALDPDDPDSAAALPALEAQRAALQAQLAQLQAQAAAAGAKKAVLQAQLDTVNTALGVIDAQLAAQDMTRESLPETIVQLRENLAQVNDGIAQIEETLSQLESGEMQLSDALATLSQAKTEGLLQLADAAAQITVNSATISSALEQVDAGLDSVEDSRANALASADITDSITLSTVSSILSAQNFSMPAGYVEQDGISYMVSVGDALTDEEELASLLLFDTGKDGIGPIYLKDVAEIFVTDNAGESYAKLNMENALILSFDKQSTAATAEVTENLGKRFDELAEEYPGLEFVPLMDQGEYIGIIVDSIFESLITGAVFAIIILFLFLRDIRPTIITLIAIPVSLVFAVVLMYFTGVTLNMISLSGLAVTVGMLVDNAIVVIENVYRLRSKGATAIQAAAAGTRQVAGAITASTLTTVCVFLPIVFVKGITRQLFTDLALTMGFALMASLIIALTLVPAMAKGMLRDTKKKKALAANGKAPGESRFYRGYRKTIAWSLNHKWVILPAAVLLLALSAWGALARGFSYMPEIDMNTVSITVTMPEDASREDAVSTADDILSRIATVDNVEYVGAMMGSSGLMGSGNSYDVTIYVGLPEGTSGAAAGKEIAALCADLDCEIAYDSALMNMSYLTGSGVSVYVYGNDMEDLQSAARDIAAALSSVEGLENADDGLDNAADAIHVAVDKNAAMEKGYTVAQLYSEIASALTDSRTAMEMETGSVTADVLVENSTGITREELAALPIEYTNADGEKDTFTLDEVATLEDTVSLNTIYRENQRRYLGVTAAVAEGYNVTLITSDAEKAVAALDLPDGISYEFDGENETIMEAIGDLLLMLLLGMVLVYAVMVAQFQSLKGPFIVMFTIPLAFTGGFLALLICGLDVSIISLIGFVMLMGIIVNNGIVLVDYVNRLRADGMSRREALIEAGATRLRPILMTSLTTILGLAVMALGRDPGTALMQPIAVVCIGGLLYATAMTLLVVPCIYDIMSKRDITVISDEDMEFSEL